MFADRIAVVTGGASGIGQATAWRLAAGGARVAVLDIDTDRAAATVKGLDGAIAVDCDVTSTSAVEAAFAHVQERLGGLDILVNSVSPLGDDTKKTTLGELAKRADPSAGAPLSATVALTDDEWAAEFRTVLFGVFACTRAALRTMIPQHRGSVVSLSSIHGIAGGEGLPHYSAAKAGVLGFTRSVAKEVAAHGVRINAVASGYADTPLLQRMMPLAMQQSVAKKTPIGRLGRAEEIAAVVCFLASDEASFVTGQTISPNGGWLTV
jgi:3-oxoacyl-[acyl-carrier protein] reductase